MILEAGATIEIRYPKANKVNAFAFVNGKTETPDNFDQYDGVYVQHLVDSNDDDYNIIRIIVGVDTIIDGTNKTATKFTQTTNN